MMEYAGGEVISGVAYRRLNVLVENGLLNYYNVDHIRNRDKSDLW